MPAFPTINAHRLLYHADGTEVGYNNTYDFANGVAAYLTQNQRDALQADNNTDTLDAIGADGAVSERCLWFFFPEKRDITHMHVSLSSELQNSGYALLDIQGSNDTTNGVDGTWEPFTYTEADVLKWKPSETDWRTPGALTPPAGGASFLTIRFRITITDYPQLRNVHLYGRKSAGETPQDIVFLQSDTTEYTALHDFGSVTEGQVYTIDVYAKNTSPTQTANSITIATGGTYASTLQLSLDDSAYTASVAIPSLAPGASQLIKVRNTVGNSPQRLLPRSAYIHATVTSWT